MTEGQFNAKLVKALRENLGPAAVTFKHADSFTAGIPDISVTLDGYTLWIESKLSTNKRLYEPLQMAMLRKLGGYYVIWNPDKKEGCLLTAGGASTMEWLPFAGLVEAITNKVKNGA